jgi:hypothetical protein
MGGLIKTLCVLADAMGRNARPLAIKRLERALRTLRRKRQGCFLSQDFMHDSAMHIGKAEVPPTKAVGQTFMVQAKQV